MKRMGITKTIKKKSLISSGITLVCFLFLFSGEAYSSCGTRGDLQKRMASCNRTCVYKNSQGKEFLWRLVVETTYGKQVWLDVQQKRIWSDSSTYSYSFEDVKFLCQKESIDREALGYIHFGYWEWPYDYEYQKAQSHGLNSCLPRFQYESFWARSPFENRKFVFNGDSGKIESIPWRSLTFFPVRCVQKVSL